jgi:hypothetical protein
MAATATIRFPDQLKIRAPLNMGRAIEIAAEQKHTTASEYARQALLRCLAEDGVHLAAGNITQTIRRPA